MNDETMAREAIGEAVALLRVAQADPRGEVLALDLAQRRVLDALAWALGVGGVRRG